MGLSLPSRERGLKLRMWNRHEHEKIVAPFAGAWIEILKKMVNVQKRILSLPSRERGLKYRKCSNFGVAGSRSLRGSVD